MKISFWNYNSGNLYIDEIGKKLKIMDDRSRLTLKMSIVDPKLNESIMKICTCLKILNCFTSSMCDNESFPL